MNRDSTPTEQEVADGMSVDEMVRLLRAMPIPDHLGGGLCKQAADMLAYLWAQDGLLSKAQDEAERAREELAETKRPLTAQMARLNQHLIDVTSRGETLSRENAELRAALAEFAKDALVSLMSDISEDCYCAGWMSGLESDLWARMVGDLPPAYGQSEVAKDDLNRLRELSNMAGGFWVWNDGNEFVSLDFWRREYAKTEIGRAVISRTQGDLAKSSTEATNASLDRSVKLDREIGDNS